MEPESKKIAEDIRNAQLERDLERLERMVDSLTRQLAAARREIKEVREIADEAIDEVEEIGDAVEAGNSASGNDADEESEEIGPELTPPHAYKVIVSSEQKVFVFLPKNPDGTYFPVAMGGKHLGASTGETADLDAGPYPAGGPVSGSERPTWAHWGWYELEDTLDTESGEVNDKLVIASFSVPRDPPEDERDDDTQVEGPKLTGVSLMDAEDWQDHAEQTWKEFDPGGSAPLTREVVIAHIANGLVTQITMTPFLSPGDGGADDWHADSEGGVNFSIDPVSRVPEYETEDESVEVPTYKTVIGLDGKPTKVRTGTKTVTRQKVKLDGNGQPIAKQAQQLDENGEPAVDGQGDPIMGPCFTETLYHQVHNFDSGNDNGLVELADENNYGGTQVACRIPGAGGAELFWRRIPRSPGQFCPPTYALDEQAGSGCTEKSIVLKKTEYTKDRYGNCQPGTPVAVGNPVSIPKPPEYSLSVSGTCTKTVALMKTPCGGQSAQSGDSFEFSVPPTVTVVPEQEPADASSRTKAGTITVTPCSGSPTTMNVYNGKDGKPGCPPGITDYHGIPVEDRPKDSDGRTAAMVVIQRDRNANGDCASTGVVAYVYDGKDGEDGILTAPPTMVNVDDFRIYNGYVQKHVNTYTLSNGRYTLSSEWVDTQLKIINCS